MADEAMKRLINVLENIDNELRETQDALKRRAVLADRSITASVTVEHYRGMLRAASLIINDVAAAERGGWIA